MRVLVDLRCLQAPPPRGGVGVFAEHAVHALLARDQENEYLLFANGLVHPQQHLPTYNAPNARWVVGHWPNKLLNPLYAVRHTPYAFPDADVIFLPNLNFIPRIPARTRLVVTVHDLSFEHFPDYFTPKQRLWHRMIRPRALLERADMVIAVSETTKRDVVETYAIPEAKVRVVYPGVSRESSVVSREHIERTRSHYQLSAPYMLSLSERSPRKNIDGLITAFELLTPLASRLSPLDLVIAGLPGSASRAIHRQIARSPACERIRLIGSIPEHEKRALLSCASCFVYPSFWEGFGFPPLEAMQAGVPVVASTGGALPEILGNAALLVDPLDPTAIARAIDDVLTNAHLRRTLVARGAARAQSYTWQRAGEQLHAALTA